MKIKNRKGIKKNKNETMLTSHLQSKQKHLQGTPRLKTPKLVLESPYKLNWAKLTKKETKQIVKALSGLRDELFDGSNELSKPAWSVLRKLSKTDRVKMISEHREALLNQMSEDARADYLRKEAFKKEKLSCLFLGYNQIMRKLRKNECAAVIINKSCVPEFLPYTFVTACSVRNVPFIPVENLNQILKKCIAVGFDLSVQCNKSPFFSIYSKIRKIYLRFSAVESQLLLPDVTAGTKIENESENTSESNEEQDDSPDPVTLEGLKAKVPYSGKDSNPDIKSVQKRRRISSSFSSEINESAYLLKRTRMDQRVFIPGVGINSLATTAEDNLMLISSALPEESAAATAFDFRVSSSSNKKKSKGTNKEDASVLGGNSNYERKWPAKCHDVSKGTDDKLSREPDFGWSNFDDMFGLDVKGDVASDEDVEESDDNKCAETANTSEKRKRHCSSTSNYIPATIVRVVANLKRRKM